MTTKTLKPLLIALITFAAFSALEKTGLAQTSAIRLAPAVKSVPALPAGLTPAQVQQLQNQLPPGAIVGEPVVAEPVNSPRLTRTLQLKFNRSPETVLKTWSKIHGDGDSALKLPPQPPEPETEADRLADIQQEVQRFEDNVILGRWEDAKSFFAGFDNSEEAKQAYEYLLSKLRSRPASSRPEPGVVPDDHVIKPSDIHGILSLAPADLTKSQLDIAGQLLARSIQQGYKIDSFLKSLETGTGILGGKEESGRVKAARVLVAANLPDEASLFLKDASQAESDGDVESLMLLSQATRRLYQTDRKPELLEQAWKINQIILSLPEIEDTEKDEALQFAVSLAPKVKQELGQKWMRESFTANPQRGVQIIAGIGSATFRGQTVYRANPSERIEGLKLQKLAVETLLDAVDDTNQTWNLTLDLLASSWLKEAQFTQTYASSAGVPSFRRDRYGNIFYANDNEMMGMSRTSSRNRPTPIPVHEIIELRPEGKWFDGISDKLQNRFREVYARLYLKNQEEEKAFPFIEKIAESDQKTATNLVREFLTVWTRNHNPNINQTNQNRYIFFYGFEQRANSIPLTRSKQQRNLRELRQWIARLRKLNLEKIDEQQLVNAFTTCHSTAEVYRIEDIENVFGSIDTLEADTIAGLAQTMRRNLTSSWRKPAVQQQKNTNRKEPDIQKEVVRGYTVARQIVDKALRATPKHWRLQLAKACITFDENLYAQELQKSSEFTMKQKEVYQQFADAAKCYAEEVPNLKEVEHETEVYDLWFYAALGACDLALLDHKKVSAKNEFPRIKAAIEQLPGEAGNSHMATFANKLFTRMSPLKPEMKYRYLKGGFDIVEDHKDAWEARKVFQYYQDLVAEIELVTKIDGSDIVGEKPFGIYVSLYHTEEVERESGGFAKYLQNQNNMQYAYNYGRPTNDYRDAFETSSITALSEHFEVISVTFEDEKNLESREGPEPGWRTTPYAYILLKARGREVDMIPPVKLDLDFLDTSGYAVLPIESKAIPVDTMTDGEARPMSNLSITQTLDERRAGEGKLVLEVKATAVGLIPDFNQILNLQASGFEVLEEQDQGVSVSAFDPEANEIQILTEREWLIELKAKEDAGEPNEFAFCETTVDDAEMAFKRYEDADLVEVEPVVSLENTYGAPDRSWVYWLAGGVPVLIIVIGLFIALSRMPTTEVSQRYEIPAEVTPLSVISLLKQIRGDGRIEDSERSELDLSIDRIEQHFFYTENGEIPDLDSMARKWVAKAN